MIKKERLSNYELLRIISMLFIICSHIISHGKVLEYSTGNLEKVLVFIYFIINVHVNSYIMISGYFSSKSEFSWKKIIKLINTAWFYRILIIIIFLILGTYIFSTEDYFNNLLPIGNKYWFLRDYLALLLFSPLLNLFIQKTGKKTYRQFLIGLFVLFVILPTISDGNIFSVSNGYSLYHFIFIYLIGGYIRKFDIIDKINNYKYIRLKLIAIFMIGVITNFVLYYFLLNNHNINSKYSFIINNLYHAISGYNNPITIIESISFFMFFGTIHFKSKIVNYISKLTFSIYLIHDNSYVRYFIYKKFWKYYCIYLTDIKSTLWSLAIFTIEIFIICGLIEIIRLAIIELLSYIINKLNRKEKKFLLKEYL